MPIKDYLKEQIKEKKTKIDTYKKRSDESDDIAEVRQIGELLSDLRDEINAMEEQLASLEEGEPVDPAPGEGESEGASRAQIINGEVRGSYAMGTPAAPESDPYDTPEYRTAFMEYVCRGVPIPQNRAFTTTTDASAVIPTTIMNEIIKEMKSYGELWARVRKLNVQGGVEIPILSLKPTAKWVTESAPSGDQKIESNTSIMFSYFMVECKIAQSLLVNVTTLSMFQELFVSLATEAIVGAGELSIIKGTGSGQPLGVTVDPRVPAANQIEISAADVATWKGWKKEVFARMKKSYRNGLFIMAQSTFDANIDGMVDANGQPIARVNYGIADSETYRFGGKEVLTVEDDILAPYTEASAGEVFAIFMNLNDYVVNSNLQFTAEKWTDPDTNQVKNKLYAIMDGKLADPNGVLIIKKGA